MATKGTRVGLPVNQPMVNLECGCNHTRYGVVRCEPHTRAFVLQSRVYRQFIWPQRAVRRC